MENCEKTIYKLPFYIIKYVGLWPYKTKYITNLIKWYGLVCMITSENIGMPVTFNFN